MTDSPDDRLNDFLAPGFSADELPGLALLLRGRELLRAFSALFHGGEGGVLARLLVLRTLGARIDPPDISPAEVRERLCYLDPVKLDTILGRLKDHELVVWEAEIQRYRVSPLGRKTLAALSTLLEFEAFDHDGVGYLTAQIAASQAVGVVPSDELSHLLSRLTELRDDFDRAVLSGSEYRIRAASARLDQVWQWVERGTDVVRKITADPDLDLDPSTHRLAQAVGRAQSALLRQASVFARALNQIDRDRIHLGQSGLSSSDLVGWLREQSAERLAEFAEELWIAPPRPAFIQDQIALDVAEFELVDRERAAQQVSALPDGAKAPRTDALPIETEDTSRLQRWRDELGEVRRETALSKLVPSEDYAASAYRLSLLGLLGDPESAALDGPAADIARLSLRVTFSNDKIDLRGRGGIALMSAGDVRPLAAPAEE
ncbi:hypothetical protein [Aquimonas voraii]|uniref:Uncharacterized protein n=1 Tax=Aquimonas voraii TaxID=265719 RepID=A0A1G6UJX6_9GAMM|nr:hypothetical protein [Aquimonas voraii]SDD41662.1 hypothetical protein SAMN04488509_102375 [Aquimonas voraii]